jgi:hypothetical protein
LREKLIKINGLIEVKIANKGLLFRSVTGEARRSIAGVLHDLSREEVPV